MTRRKNIVFPIGFNHSLTKKNIEEILRDFSNVEDILYVSGDVAGAYKSIMDIFNVQEMFEESKWAGYRLDRISVSSEHGMSSSHSPKITVDDPISTYAVFTRVADKYAALEHSSRHTEFLRLCDDFEDAQDACLKWVRRQISYVSRSGRTHIEDPFNVLSGESWVDLT